MAAEGLLIAVVVIAVILILAVGVYIFSIWDAKATQRLHELQTALNTIKQSRPEQDVEQQMVLGPAAPQVPDQAPKVRPVNAWQQPGAHPSTLPDRFTKVAEGNGRSLERWGSNPDVRTREEDELVDMLLDDSRSPTRQFSGRQVISNPLFGAASPSSSNRNQAAPRTNSQLYPGTNVGPGVFVDRKWEVDDLEYRPAAYTSPAVLSVTGGNANVDPGLATIMRPGAMMWNEMDTNFHPPVDRRSHNGLYTLFEGIPLNPLGRTGFSGRGSLPRWGPNHVVVMAVTRTVTEMGQEPRVQVIAKKTKAGAQCALPSGVLPAGLKPENAAPFLMAVDLLAEHATSATAEALAKAIGPVMGPAGYILKQEIVRDLRNTDNAWIEVFAANHNLKPELNTQLDTVLEETTSGLMWIDFDGGALDLVANQKGLSSSLQELYRELVKHGPKVTVDVPTVVASPGPTTAHQGAALHPDHDPEPRPDPDPDPEPEPEHQLEENALVTTNEADSPDADVLQIMKESMAETPRTGVIAERKASTLSVYAPDDNGHSAEVPDDTLIRKTTSYSENTEMNTVSDADASKSPLSPRKGSASSALANIPEPSAKPAVQQVQERLPKDGEVRVDVVKWLGTVPTDSQGGSSAVSDAIKELKTGNYMDEKIVRIVIGAEGIELQEPPESVGTSPDKKRLDPSVFKEVTKVIKDIGIQSISYTGSDKANKKVFAFIANNPSKHRGSDMNVYVFETKKARHLCEAVKESFIVAQAIKKDPFAVKRSMPATPNAGDDFPELAKYVVNRQGLTSKRIIGHGQYGKVYLADVEEGSCKGDATRAAVKLMRPNLGHVDGNDFLGEAVMMSKFDHPQLMSLLGVCVEKKPWLILVEFMHYKDLGLVLKHTKKLGCLLRSHEMLTFCVQVASGMCFLAEQRFIHRDLAARNVMLTHQNKVRIGDFGLARQIPEDKDYWKLDKAGRLPVKYMALESLTLKRFYIASDVWSFGVYMWEVMSYGAVPWVAEKIPNTEVKSAVRKGVRIGKAKMALLDDEGAGADNTASGDNAKFWNWWYTLMVQTWKADHKQRPTFPDILEILQSRHALEEGRHPPARDVGQLCYDALENSKALSPIHARGGSIIRAAATLKRKGNENEADGPANGL